MSEVIPEEAVEAAASAWKVEKVRARIRSGGKQREFIWEVTCPATPPSPEWDNDFWPESCGCMRFPTEGKAMRYVERMTGGAK